MLNNTWKFTLDISYCVQEIRHTYRDYLDNTYKNIKKNSSCFLKVRFVKKSQYLFMYFKVCVSPCASITPVGLSND